MEKEAPESTVLTGDPCYKRTSKTGVSVQYVLADSNRVVNMAPF